MNVFYEMFSGKFRRLKNSHALLLLDDADNCKVQKYRVISESTYTNNIKSKVTILSICFKGFFSDLNFSMNVQKTKSNLT